MPDHIHLLIKIKEVEKRKSLPVLVWQLCRALSAEYSRIAGGRSHLPQNLAVPDRGLRLPAAPGSLPAQAGNPLSPDWHNWIVKKSGQLAAFRRYIKENPIRAHLRLFRLLSPLGDLESWRSGGVKLLNSQSPKLQEAKAKKLKRLVVSG